MMAELHVVTHMQVRVERRVAYVSPETMPILVCIAYLRTPSELSKSRTLRDIGKKALTTTAKCLQSFAAAYCTYRLVLNLHTAKALHWL